MGRKLKTAGMLVLVLALIYVQQTPAICAENTEENTEENAGGEEPETEDPEEPVLSFQAEIPKEDGENGWYVTRPEIKIRHRSGRGITKYKVEKDQKVKAEGSLEKEGEEVLLKKDVFEDGKSVLSVWMEEGGKLVEEYSLKQEICVDTKTPEFQMKVSKGFAAWYQEAVKVHVTGTDGESGVEKIACYVDGTYVGERKESKGEFLVQKPSVNGQPIAVTVVARDKAGKQSSQIESLYIDGKEPQVKISGAEDYLITSRPVTVDYEIKEENVLSEFRADTKWERVDGVKKILPVSEWEKTKTGQKVSQTLTEDGIYQIHVSAKDRAGYHAGERKQVIIDKENPVIRYVDDLQGRYMKHFSWNYPKEELIKDFTTYSYGIRVDGGVYPMGKTIREEGRHLLEVQAKDAAGNEATAQAEFVIDHTKPEILFKNVEEGQEYEEKCVCEVELENAEDTIWRVQINGENKKINPGSASVQYTLQDHQDYEVKVMAKDQAGNQTEKSISFKVVPKKNVFQKMAEPVVQKLKGESVREKDQKEDQEAEEDQENNMIVWIVLLLGISAAVGWQYWRKHKS